MSEDNKPVDLVTWLGFRSQIYFSVAKPLGGLFGALTILFVLALLVALGLSTFMFFKSSFGGLHLDARNYALTLAAILAAPFVVWRSVVAQKQTDIAEQGLITDRINKAIEQLGSEKTAWDDNKQSRKPNLEVRLGGIYALERIAQDSERDHISVMEILCAYVRENASRYDPNYIKNNPIPRSDIEAAMTVIGRRSVNRINFERDSSRNGLPAPYRLELDSVHLISIKLNYARLDHANLSNTDFSEARLKGTRFCGAVMFEAILENSWVDGADFTLSLVIEIDFTATSKLTDDQIESMFGDSTTKLPKSAKQPKWINLTVDHDEANTIWQAAKKQAGM